MSLAAAEQYYEPKSHTMNPNEQQGGSSSEGGGIVKRKSSRTNSISRSNSIVFKSIPEIASYESSEEDDDSSAQSLTLAGLDPASAHGNFSVTSSGGGEGGEGRQYALPEPRRSVAYNNDNTSTTQGRNFSEGTSTQSTRTRPPSMFSAVKRFAKHVSSLGLASTSEGPKNHTSAASTASPPRRRNTGNRTQQNKRSSRLSARTTSASVMSNVDTTPEKYCLSDQKINALRYIIAHPVWTWTTGFFVFLMLFGAALQDLFLPMSTDVAVDVIFVIAFATLMLDIIIRCIVDKAYFAWDRVGIALTPRNKCKWLNTHAASFMFWCDLIGTIAFLYDIPCVNPDKRRPAMANLTMNDGVSVRYGAPYNYSYASTDYDVNWEVLVVIGRTARLARPIRLVEGMHVYVTRNERLRYFIPTYWLRKLASLQHYRIKRGRNIKDLNHASERALVGSAVSTPGNMFSIDDSLTLRRGSSSLRKSSMVKVTEEQDSESNAEKNMRRSKCFCFPKCFMNFEGNLIPREITSRRSTGDGADSDDGNKTERDHYFGNSKDPRSHVGAAMQQLTGQRVALGVFVAFLLNVLCSWQRDDPTEMMAMAVLHGQTKNDMFAKQAVDTARASVIPNLYFYAVGENILLNESIPADLRQRDLLYITTFSERDGSNTTGYFNNEVAQEQFALVEIITTLFIIVVWLVGILAFVGPVMILVVEPIERMVRLLGMLMKDPLGYANTKEFRDFMREEENFNEQSMWGKDVLSGMETHFLMKTLLRIGSLMKVGFGSAGVEIIRNNLERGRRKDVLFLNKQGSTVSCIFLFCDIRQFTDATECLQESVFVFTNKIAAVVHSICNSWGGTANKNIGDAFLVTWLLDEEVSDGGKEEEKEEEDFSTSTTQVMFSSVSENLYARNNQAERALLAVVKISIALHYDNFFVESLNEEARNRLLTKLSKRKGPIVQMGFGLHAGNAVQGAIGSQRKLDATYLSESVERAEFLESSTKTYGVPLLMSESFYSLLDSTNKYRCRKVDQLIYLGPENDSLTDPREILDTGEKMSIYTFDMDIDALWRAPPANEDDGYSTTSNSDVEVRRSAKMNTLKRRTSVRRLTVGGGGAEILGNSTLTKGRSSRRLSLTTSVNSPFRDTENSTDDIETPESRKRTLVLPSGISKYSDKSWLEPDIKTIRHDLVSNGVFFPKFDDGLKSYYAKDWDHAKKCFETVLSQRDDGPSRYYLKCMEKHAGQPPRDFIGYKVSK